MAARRNLESSAVTALAPLAAVLPVWLLALFIIWLPLRLAWDVTFPALALGYLAAVVLLFWRPVQVWVLAPLLGARHPSRDQMARLAPAWRAVLQATDLPARRYVLAVLPSHELNAFACGGHLVVVTSYAIDTLPRDELSGVLAHELSHHLGLHTVALTVMQWLSLPVMVLARLGFFLLNVATAATASFGQRSPLVAVLGRLVGAVLTAVSWVLLTGLIASNFLANLVGRRAEYQADQRVVSMGFGRALANALRRVIAAGGGGRPVGWRERLEATHPPARTRVALIEARVARDRLPDEYF
jgi:Zn-dependent protease with chaperone function